MKRTRQTLRSAASPSCSKRSATAGSRFGCGLILAQPIGLYGHSVWDVSPAGGSVRTLSTDLRPAFAGLPGSDAPRRLARQVQSQNVRFEQTARRRHELGRKRRLSLRLANGSAREIKTDFTLLIGVANLLAFETTVLTLFLLCWYISSGLSSAAL